MYTDSHCHLDPDVYGGDEGVDAAIARARAAGVTRMVTIGSGYGLPGANRAAPVATRHDGVWFTVGVHPHDAKDFTGDVERWLEDVARSEPKCVALGEMGLDFHYDNSPRDVQRDVLKTQLRLAKRVGKPIVIHDRESLGETLRILDEEAAFPSQGGPGVVYHCFTGTVAEMREIVARGGYVSIPGIVTFKTAEEMRSVAKEVPLDRVFVETDSPFLTPIPWRGQKNEPARVVKVAEKIAEVRGMAVEDVARATSENAARFFGLG